MLPHDFDVLLSGNTRPVLLVGAGTSYGLVPGPADLLKRYKAEVDDFLEKEFGFGKIDVDDNNPTELYRWADIVLNELGKSFAGKEKLVLAELLGLLTERRWTTVVGIELSGTTPRHRVIARFAKEQLWKSIWSLNWDTILESAFERVGLERSATLTDQGWPTAFATTLTRDDFGRNNGQHVVEICKPHGCVHGLAEAKACAMNGDINRSQTLSSRFMIGERELSEDRANDHDDAFFDRLRDHVRTAPLIAIGWRATEPSLKRAIRTSVGAANAPPHRNSLTIVDPVLNAEGHAELLTTYKLPAAQVHCRVNVDSAPTSDHLFLWLQARYSLQKLAGWACDDWKPAVQARIDEIPNGTLTTFTSSFADTFLPAWIRLCWRAGIIELPPGNKPEMLDLEKPDQHVPLNGPQTTRRDLKAAAGLVSLVRGHEQRWNLGKFPGCLWSSEDQRLVVPMPAWGDPNHANDLRAVKVLLRNVQNGAGFVKSAAILPLKCGPNDVIHPNWNTYHQVILASCARTAALARPDAWDVIQDLGANTGAPT